MLLRFAEWLSLTWLSVQIQTHNAWVIPTIQSIHIVAIGLVVGSALMIDLRVLGFAGHDQTLDETRNRYAPWMSAALVVLLITGILMVIGEPVRELMTFSFWFKMSLVVIGTMLQTVVNRRSVKSLAVLTLLVWIGIIILGRLIAYDHLWGSWSLKPTE